MTFIQGVPCHRSNSRYIIIDKPLALPMTEGSDLKGRALIAAISFGQHELKLDQVS